MEDLKPCPFCGASDTSDVYVDRLQNDGRRWAVRCDALDCIVEGPHRATKREAITAWNTRTDISNALIAAAYEAAADKCFNPEWSVKTSTDHIQARTSGLIRALTSDDARAAYDAAIRAAKIEGMREAANRANGCDRISEVAPAITALIEETEKGGT